MNGGGKGAGCELSRRGEAKPLGTMRKPASRAFFEGLRIFAPGRDCPLSAVRKPAMLGFESRARIQTLLRPKT